MKRTWASLFPEKWRRYCWSIRDFHGGFSSFRERPTDQDVTGGIHLIAPAFRNSKLGNVKPLVALETVSGLLPQLEEDLADDLGFLQSRPALGQSSQRLFHLGRRRRQSQ